MSGNGEGRFHARVEPLSREELVALHRREWRNHDGRLAKFAHNLMPFVGVVALGLGVALLMHRTSLDPPVITLTRSQFLGAWLALMGLVGLPSLCAGWRERNFPDGGFGP